MRVVCGALMQEQTDALDKHNFSIPPRESANVIE